MCWNRRCDVSFEIIDKNICSKIETFDPKAKCIYNNEYKKCQKVYTKCEDYGSSCYYVVPWLEEKNDFNYYYKCLRKLKEGSTNSYECIEERRNCTEYYGDDEATPVFLWDQVTQIKGVLSMKQKPTQNVTNNTNLAKYIMIL